MKIWLTFLLLTVFTCFGQDALVINESASFLGVSVSDGITVYESTDNSVTPQDFLKKPSAFVSRKMSSRLVNLDFTTSSFFVHFKVENKTGKKLDLVLETARPITNGVELYCVETGKTALSGDGIPFKLKTIPTNFSVLPVNVPVNESREYVLKVTSDGENLTLPMFFSKRQVFQKSDGDRHVFLGVFLGVFVFVVIIYFNFFIMLRERLFLVYIIYASFSGLLQFSLDGYFHRFVFTSGGYFAQHIVLFIGGLTVVFGIFYAGMYLQLKGTLRKIQFGLLAFVVATTLLSIFPGPTYKLGYPLINGFSFLSLVFLLYAGYRQGKKQPVSNLFMVGFGSLVIGAIVFILGNFGIIDSPFITLNALKIGTLLEMIFLSILMAGRYKSLQVERERAQQALVIELGEKNKSAQEANLRLEEQVAERTKEIEAQRILLKEKNEDFIASITYAERIQSAVLSNEGKFKNLFPDSFVLLQPKALVSGDFYWVDLLDSENKEDSNFIGYVTADCTGHGVPGALVSIIGNHVLEAGKVSNGLLNPGKALDELSSGMNAALNSRYASQQMRDGMDLTLCVLDKKERMLHFSGARNSAYVVRKGELIELKGDRKSIGFNPEEETHEFQTQTFQLEIGDMLYTCTDGYADQFGGPRGKKFMAKQLKSLFVELSELPVNEQIAKLDSTLKEWMGEHDQLDDILVIGIQITE